MDERAVQATAHHKYKAGGRFVSCPVLTLLLALVSLKGAHHGCASLVASPPVSPVRQLCLPRIAWAIASLHASCWTQRTSLCNANEIENFYDANAAGTSCLPGESRLMRDGGMGVMDMGQQPGCLLECWKFKQLYKVS